MKILRGMRTLLIFIGLVLGTTVVSPLFGENLTSGLVGVWHFDKGTGTIAKNSLDANNIGKIFGASWAKGKSGFGLRFNGINDYVNIPTSDRLDNITDQITITVWIKPSVPLDSMGKNIFFVAKGSRATLNYHYKRGLEFSCYIGNKIRYLPKPVNIPDGEWHQIVGTYDGEEMRLYLDGKLINSVLQTGTVDIKGPNLYVGTPPGKETFFKGIIDEVKIWDRALRINEVRTAYNLLANDPLPSLKEDLQMHLEKRHRIKVIVLESFATQHMLNYSRMRQLKKIGVDAVQVGIRWSDIEPKEGKYDWSTIAPRIRQAREAGMPIYIRFGFQRAPRWVEKYDLAFRNPEGKPNMDWSTQATESTSYWNPKAKKLIAKQVKAFYEEFGSKGIAGVYLTFAGWTEAQYPTNSGATFWSFDRYALKDFRNKMERKYLGNLKEFNKRNNQDYQSWEKVVPAKTYREAMKYPDFLKWYNQSLLDYIDWMWTMGSKYYKTIGIIYNVNFGQGPGTVYSGTLNLTENLSKLAQKYKKKGITIIFSYGSMTLARDDYAEHIAHHYRIKHWFEANGGDFSHQISKAIMADADGIVITPEEGIAGGGTENLFDKDNKPTFRFEELKYLVERAHDIPLPEQKSFLKRYGRLFSVDNSYYRVVIGNDRGAWGTISEICAKKGDGKNPVIALSFGGVNLKNRTDQFDQFSYSLEKINSSASRVKLIKDGKEKIILRTGGRYADHRATVHLWRKKREELPLKFKVDYIFLRNQPEFYVRLEQEWEKPTKASEFMALKAIFWPPFANIVRFIDKSGSLVTVTGLDSISVSELGQDWMDISNKKGKGIGIIFGGGITPRGPFKGSEGFSKFRTTSLLPQSRWFWGKWMWTFHPVMRALQVFWTPENSLNQGKYRIEFVLYPHAEGGYKATENRAKEIGG